MNNVIEFKSRKTDMYEVKLARFQELKPRSFSDTLSLAEEIEFDKLYDWLQIHKENNNQKNKKRMCN
jgi:hypothetical protein